MVTGKSDTAPVNTPNSGGSGKKVKGVFIKSASLADRIHPRGEKFSMPEKDAKRLEKAGFFKISS